MPAQVPLAVESLKVTVAPLQASVAVAVPVLAGSVESVHAMFALAGQVIVGPCVLVTVMIWSQLTELPHASIAVQVRVMTWLPAQLAGASTSV